MTINVHKKQAAKLQTSKIVPKNVMDFEHPTYTGFISS